MMCMRPLPIVSCHAPACGLPLSQSDSETFVIISIRCRLSSLLCAIILAAARDSSERTGKSPGLGVGRMARKHIAVIFDLDTGVHLEVRSAKPLWRMEK